MSAPAPTLPERYTLVRHVADGGMAAVWEATDELLGRNVAVKVLAPALAADEDARRRFTREARAAARLSTHPHVVTVYDAGEHGGQTFLVMALYPGGTVADRLARGPIPRAQALDWLEDAASALDAAHAEGVVHRDVKPANLLLDAHEHVAVGDFGIATAAWESAMTSTGMVLGTLAFLAPEQRAGGAATPASDRYALGLVARQLLTGAKPGTESAPGRALPSAAEAVLLRATAERPQDRPASCVGLVRELDAALGTATHAAAPRLRAVASGEEPTTVGPAAVVPRVPRAPATGPATRVASPSPSEPAPALAPRRPAGPDAARREAPAPAPHEEEARRGGRFLALLAALALVVAGGAVAVSAFDSNGTDAPTRSTQASTKKKTTKKVTPTKSAPTPVPPPVPEPTTTEAAPPAQKSRADLITQNDAAFRATNGAPAAQVAPLREAVDGLCVDESDRNCAYALFNLARALRLSGQPAEAVPLLERRLSISDVKVGEVQAELARAQQEAGAAPAGSPPPAGGKGKQGKKG